jgi:hypothetical protein
MLFRSLEENFLMRFWSENLKGKDNLEYPDEDRRLDIKIKEW